MPKWIDHVSRWVDEVVVFDKQSTDGTAAIAQSAGARAVSIPFSVSGYDDVAGMVSQLKFDWFVCLTPSTWATPSLAAIFRQFIQNDDGETDSVWAVHKAYSFGKHDPNYPGHLIYSPRLLHRNRIIISNQIHNNFQSKGKAKMVNNDGTAFTYHLSTPTFSNFIRKCHDYSLVSAETCSNPFEKAKEAVSALSHSEFDILTSKNLDLRHFLAHKLGGYATALAYLDQAMRNETEEAYDNIRAELGQQWSAFPKRF